MPQERSFRVYRYDPATTTMTIAFGDMARPNGLCFSPDESKLYVVDTPGVRPKSTWVYDIVDRGTRAVDGLVFFGGNGWADGIRWDTEGNVWCGFSGGEVAKTERDAHEPAGPHHIASSETSVRESPGPPQYRSERHRVRRS